MIQLYRLGLARQISTYPAGEVSILGHELDQKLGQSVPCSVVAQFMTTLQMGLRVHSVAEVIESKGTSHRRIRNITQLEGVSFRIKTCRTSFGERGLKRVFG